MLTKKILLPIAIFCITTSALALSFDDAIAYWQFDSLNDSNGANSNLTTTTGTIGNVDSIPVFGSNNRFGRVVGDSFNGQQGFANELKFSGDYTSFVRFRWSNQVNLGSLIMGKLPSGASGEFGYNIRVRDNIIAGGSFIGNGVEVDPVKPGFGNAFLGVAVNNSVQADTWYDITVTYRSSGTWSLFVFDSLAGTKLGEFTVSHVSPGSHNDPHDSSFDLLLGQNHINGGIDIESAAVWNVALSAEEVATFSTPVPIPEPRSIILLLTSVLLLYIRSYRRH